MKSDQSAWNVVVPDFEGGVRRYATPASQTAGYGFEHAHNKVC